jgi:endonuclease I
MRLLGLSVFFVIYHLTAFATDSRDASLGEYYGADFAQNFRSGHLENRPLLDELQKITSAKHISLGYDGARRVLFGKIFLEKVGGAWAVKDVYCERTVTQQHDSIGPNLIPSATEINTEHTWPQSKFTGRFRRDLQKSDLHHLFPTDSEMNSHRGSLHFGEVRHEKEKLKCPIASLGQNAHGETVFEPPQAHRGNVARAIFYFATRYQMKIDGNEEAALRHWHEQDPVDEKEAHDNEEIQKAQGNRNPYIDYPELVQHIDHFS